VDGQRLLLLFAVLMLVVAALMLRPRAVRVGDASPTSNLLPRLGSTGFATGGLAGFFGIGGGFLVVPGLMLAGRMEIIQAIGSALLTVGAFGLTTAANYALSGLVDWRIAIEFIGGGFAGGWLGALGAHRLARTRGALNRVFVAAIVAMALFILWHEVRCL